MGETTSEEEENHRGGEEEQRDNTPRPKGTTPGLGGKREHSLERGGAVSPPQGGEGGEGTHNPYRGPEQLPSYF